MVLKRCTGLVTLVVHVLLLPQIYSMLHWGCCWLLLHLVLLGSAWDSVSSVCSFQDTLQKLYGVNHPGLQHGGGL